MISELFEFGTQCAVVVISLEIHRRYSKSIQKFMNPLFESVEKKLGWR